MENIDYQNLNESNKTENYFIDTYEKEAKNKVIRANSQKNKEKNNILNNQTNLQKNTNKISKISIDANINKNDNKNIIINSPDALVTTLKHAIKDTKKQFKLMQIEHVEEIKKKTEAQQLLQKCIEDIKLEITNSTKDLLNFSKIILCKNQRNLILINLIIIKC